MSPLFVVNAFYLTSLYFVVNPRTARCFFFGQTRRELPKPLDQYSRHVLTL